MKEPHRNVGLLFLLVIYNRMEHLKFGARFKRVPVLSTTEWGTEVLEVLQELIDEPLRNQITHCRRN